ncbi:hypothetical protein J8273_2949 [Carpediemonas membranifera]|uniref:Uncharacterized protein n=1 Tax=Carpediemonas membranifera TaxID=201153 RepID=A0A8J6BDS3_9EUKA|nr:hypothetical protein J8273_2949 [Carpediemonas membranifera]|eukprot:KAG9395382.1 hypothetical protein J8273_2949 [Carpediemonas membranifera]
MVKSKALSKVLATDPAIQALKASQKTALTQQVFETVKTKASELEMELKTGTVKGQETLILVDDPQGQYQMFKKRMDLRNKAVVAEDNTDRLKPNKIALFPTIRHMEGALVMLYIAMERVGPSVACDSLVTQLSIVRPSGMPPDRTVEGYWLEAIQFFIRAGYLTKSNVHRAGVHEACDVEMSSALTAMADRKEAWRVFTAEEEGWEQVMETEWERMAN